MCVLFSLKRCQVKVLLWQCQIFREECVQVRYMLPRFYFQNSYVLTVIAGNVKRKVRGKKPSCRKGRRTWNKTSFGFNRIPQIGRRPPVSHSYPTKQLTHRARGFCPSMPHRSRQGETAEVHLKLVTTKGHQRRAACQQTLRAKVIRSGKVCDLFELCCLTTLSTSWGFFYIGPFFSFCDFIFFHYLSNLCRGVELDTDSFTLCEIVKNTSTMSDGVYKNT